VVVVSTTEVEVVAVEVLVLDGSGEVVVVVVSAPPPPQAASKMAMIIQDLSLIFASLRAAVAIPGTEVGRRTNLPRGGKG
jgi:hypothetical protein